MKIVLMLNVASAVVNATLALGPSKESVWLRALFGLLALCSFAVAGLIVLAPVIWPIFN